MIRRLVLVFLLITAVAAPPSAPAATPIRLALIPADDAEEMLRNYEPVRRYLAQRLELPVEIQVTHDYTAAIEAMRARRIDVAWFGPFSYVLANKLAGAQAMVVGIRRETGTSTYRSIFVTHRDSGIMSLADLRGRTVAFVDPASTSGYLIPTAVLRKHGLVPARDFKAAVFAGTHNAVELAIKNRKIDAGADSDTSYARMVKEGQIDRQTNVVIFTSDPIPGSPIAVRGDLDAALKGRIEQALVQMDRQTMFQVRGWGDIERYVAASDRDYDVIREVAEILNLDLRKSR